jgi:hypothetical protein
MFALVLFAAALAGNPGSLPVVAEPSPAASPQILVAMGFSLGVIPWRTAPLAQDGSGNLAGEFGVDTATWRVRDIHAGAAYGGSLGLGIEKTPDSFRAARLRARIGAAKPFFFNPQPFLLASLGVDAGPVVEYHHHRSFPVGVGLEASAWGMFSAVGVAITGRTSTHELAAVYLSFLVRLGLPVFY